MKDYPWVGRYSYLIVRTVISVIVPSIGDVTQSGDQPFYHWSEDHTQKEHKARVFSAALCTRLRPIHYLHRHLHQPGTQFNMTKFAIEFILGSFAVWQFTGRTNAKQIFFFSLAGAMTTFAVKFIQHRRTWSKLVYHLVNPR